MKIKKIVDLSQEKLGNKLNVARQTSKWELGETMPEMDKLEELSDLFEISIDKLVKDRLIPNSIIKEISRIKLEVEFQKVFRAKKLLCECGSSFYKKDDGSIIFVYYCYKQKNMESLRSRLKKCI